MAISSISSAASMPSPMARIASIQARFSAMAAASTGATTAPSTTASGADFASLLAAATGSTGTLDTSALTQALGRTNATTAGGTGAGEQVVDTAMDYLGIPYRWGGTDPSTGLDCSGFVQQVYREHGIELPRVSRDQAKQGTAVPSIAEAQPGDLIAFGEPVDHIAIYVGDNKIIHAPRTGEVIKVGEMHRTPTAIRRLVPSGTATTTGAVPGATASIATSTPELARYATLFAQAGAKYGIDANVLAAVAKVESGGNPNAVSSAGASGLMQFMPGTARAMGIDPLDPAQAIDGAARLLTQQRDEFGSLELALAAYNAGGGAVRRAGGIPPYGETQAYVTKVMGLLGGRS